MNMLPSALRISKQVSPILGNALQEYDCQAIDLSSKNLLNLNIDPDDPSSFADFIFQHQLRIGGYLEERNLYKRSAGFGKGDLERNIHLGIDIWKESGTALYAPLSGTVISVHDNVGLADYGPTLIIEHQTHAQSFFSLYGHLSSHLFELLKPGQDVDSGQLIGHIGTIEENGHWPPHVHVQLIRDLEGNKHDYPGVCAKKDLPWYRLNCPDPSLIIR